MTSEELRVRIAEMEDAVAWERCRFELGGSSRDKLQRLEAIRGSLKKLQSPAGEPPEFDQPRGVFLGP